MRKLIGLAAIAVLGAVLSVSALAATLKMAYDADPVSMDPHEQLSGGTLQLSHMIFDPQPIKHESVRFECLTDQPPHGEIVIDYKGQWSFLRLVNIFHGTLCEWCRLARALRNYLCKICAKSPLHLLLAKSVRPIFSRSSQIAARQDLYCLISDVGYFHHGATVSQANLSSFVPFAERCVLCVGSWVVVF